MLTKLWQKVQNYGRIKKGESLRSASQTLGIPKSTIHYHEQRQQKRQTDLGTDYWETEAGQNYLKRMIISVLYTFGIKAGVGCERLSEHFKHLHIDNIAAVSPSSIRRLIKEIEQSILLYKTIEESGLEANKEVQTHYLKGILGVDETWVDDLLLICQELSSGYLFLKK